MRRREFLVVVVSATTAGSVLARSQQLPTIGFLSSRSPAESMPLVKAFQEGLQEAGYAEGRNSNIEYRWAENQTERLPALAADLVSRKVAVIVAAGGYPSALAAKAATTSIPVVFTSVGNPVQAGLVRSINRPGGNVTGIDATLSATLDAKRLELLHLIAPDLRSVGALVNPKRPDAANRLTELEAAAQAMGLRLVWLKAGSDDELDAVLGFFDQQRFTALLVSADPFFSSQRDKLVAFAARLRIPAMYQWRDSVDAGGLVSYGASLAAAYHRTADYVGRILKGAHPADLPVEQPTKFELVINLKTAKALGLVVPQSILARADEVIE